MPLWNHSEAAQACNGAAKGKSSTGAADLAGKVHGLDPGDRLSAPHGPDVVGDDSLGRCGRRGRDGRTGNWLRGSRRGTAGRRRLTATGQQRQGKGPGKRDRRTLHAGLSEG